MGREGFEPPKAKPADLQSAAFNHFATCPRAQAATDRQKISTGGGMSRAVVRNCHRYCPRWPPAEKQNYSRSMTSRDGLVSVNTRTQACPDSPATHC